MDGRDLSALYDATGERTAVRGLSVYDPDLRGFLGIFGYGDRDRVAAGVPHLTKFPLSFFCAKHRRVLAAMEYHADVLADGICVFAAKHLFPQLREARADCGDPDQFCADRHLAWSEVDVSTIRDSSRVLLYSAD